MNIGKEIRRIIVIPQTEPIKREEREPIRVPIKKEEKEKEKVLV